MIIPAARSHKYMTKMKGKKKKIDSFEDASLKIYIIRYMSYCFKAYMVNNNNNNNSVAEQGIKCCRTVATARIIIEVSIIFLVRNNFFLKIVISKKVKL